MRPTDVLSAEHRVIEQVLDCLEALAVEARTRPLDVEQVRKVLEFLRTFADRCHHGKEEERLFPLLAARGMPTRMGPIAVMLDDHRAGRQFIRRMGEAADSSDAVAFVPAALGYVQLLRDHIAREDGVLFPMAESMLDEGARAALLADFEEVELVDIGPDAHARMLAIADALAERHGVKRAAQRSRAAAGGCGSGCF